MDYRLAQGLDRTLSLVGNVQLRRVGDEVTHDAQVRKAEAEKRKEVWRAVRQLKTVIQLAPAAREILAALPPGITVLACDRQLYCDGRVLAQTIGQINGQDVLYIQLVEPEEAKIMEA